MDDHISVVLDALAVVGNGKLVRGVNGEVCQRPGGRGVITVVVVGFFTAAGDLTYLGGMASSPLSLTLSSSSSLLSSLSLLLSLLAKPSSPFSEEQGGNMLDSLDIKMK
jgi:hypothetical protein